MKKLLFLLSLAFFGCAHQNKQGMPPVGTPSPKDPPNYRLKHGLPALNPHSEVPVKTPHKFSPLHKK